jgi:type IV secretion system protein VirD4
MRAMPMTPPSDGSGGQEADAEAARQAADGESSGQTHVAPKKTAPVVQAVVAEEQRQMEMDFGGQVAETEAAGADDEAQVRSAVDGLDDMEVMLRDGGGQELVAR